MSEETQGPTASLPNGNRGRWLDESGSVDAEPGRTKVYVARNRHTSDVEAAFCSVLCRVHASLMASVVDSAPLNAVQLINALIVHTSAYFGNQVTKGRGSLAFLILRIVS